MGEVNGIARPGEVNICSGRSSKDGLDRRIHGLINAVPKVADDPECEPSPRGRGAFIEPELVRICAGLRIELRGFAHGIVIEEPINAALQIVNITPCPLQQ